MDHLGKTYKQNYEQHEDHPSAKFYKSREYRSRPPPPSGKTPIYDFDEWSRVHYGQTFARDMENKRRASFKARKAYEDKNDIMTDKVMLAIAILVAFSMYFTREDQDRVLTGNSIPRQIPKE